MVVPGIHQVLHIGFEKTCGADRGRSSDHESRRLDYAAGTNYYERPEKAAPLTFQGRWGVVENGPGSSPR
ncbi:hypothetical protein BST61_g4769 [Cercospora zeina]